jgi:hypothetical protein
MTAELIDRCGTGLDETECPTASNTSRGGLIDEAALIDALRSRAPGRRGT